MDETISAMNFHFCSLSLLKNNALQDLFELFNLKI